MQDHRACLAAYVALACVASACSERFDPVSPHLGTPAVAFAANSNGSAPTSTELDLVSDALCPGITFRLEGRGKTKTLTVGKEGGVTIFLSPGLDVRLTNLATGKQVTVPISGASHQTVNANGEIETVMTGRNLSYDPVDEPHFAFTSGVFTYVVDAAGNLIEPRHGSGQITDACALIS